MTIFDSFVPHAERVRPIRVAVLGCSGSIGTQTLDVCRRHSSRVQVVALSVNGSVRALVSAAREFGAAHVAVADGSLAPGFAFGGPGEQRRMLEAEGVGFLPSGRVDMKTSKWEV